MAQAYVSKKIKITIHDPIFSGTYVFDRNVGSGDDDLLSPNWILNNSESDHNLITYQHPVSPQNNKILVSLNENDDSSVRQYKGYLELKTSLYKNENNVGAIYIEDSYAFPAHMVFTAIQPAGPFSGDGLGRPEVVAGGRPTGHRLVVGFCLPLSWDESYNTWRIINGIKYSIDNNIPISYAATPFNDGTSYFSSIDQDLVYLDNKFYISGTIDSIDTNSSGFITHPTLNTGEILPVCTGIPFFGFGFRCSASGLGYDKGYAWGRETFTNIQGIGPYNIFETHHTGWDGDDPDSDPDFVDERPFFDNKIPISGTVEFISGCNPGINCSSLQLMNNPEIINPVTKTINICNKYTIIQNDYLCNATSQFGDYGLENPGDTLWLSFNITGTKIVYSGIGDYYPASLSGGTRDTYLTYKSSNLDPIILLPYTGNPLPSYVRSWITGEYITFQDYDDEGTITYANSEKNVIDLYWKINYNTYVATGYIIPVGNESMPIPTIRVTGEDTSNIYNIYDDYKWSSKRSAFLSTVTDGLLSIKTTKNSTYLISGTYQNNQDIDGNVITDYKHLPEEYTILYSGMPIKLNEWVQFVRPTDSPMPVPPSPPSGLLTSIRSIYNIC
jgi:hypothetical protein